MAKKCSCGSKGSSSARIRGKASASTGKPMSTPRKTAKANKGMGAAKPASGARATKMAKAAGARKVSRKRMY